MTDAVVKFDALPLANGRLLGLARLNVPKALNALSLDMIRLLQAQLDAWLADERVAAIWLDGEGERAFCAGGDIVELYRSMTPVGERNPHVEQFFAEEYRLDHALHTSPKPVICFGSGVVMGGGMGLMQGSTLRLVTPTSRLAMPEITIGLYPDVGGSWFLQRTPPATGLFAGLTGVQLNAGDALFMGLADLCVAADQREAMLTALQALSLEGDDDLQVLRDALRPFQVQAPASPMLEHWPLLQQACAEQSVIKVLENLNARSGHSEWLDRALKALNRGCPQTVHIVWVLQRRARHLSLADVFRLEWILSVQCAMHPDFREGVRALLIEKDGAPRFVHADPASVPADYVDGLFRSPVAEHPLADL